MTVKDQLGRLAASSIRFGGGSKDGPGKTKNPISIIEGFDMWSPKDENQRVLWPSTVELSKPYWESLKEHAVPLEERHIAALSHSGMALDVYTWLAHRLHRVPEGKPALVTWPLLQQQFGAEIALLRNFRRFFRVALKQVLSLYRDAKVHDTDGGLVLHKSSPIVKPRVALIMSGPPHFDP
jgi:hypothetical protein